MSTPESADFISTELQKFSITDAAISELRTRLLPIKVEGETDKVGHDLARAGRLEVKALRVAIEKTRKALKADSLRFGQAVDAHAKRISQPLEQIEAHLQAQEDIVAKAAERRAVEQRAKEEAERLAREEAIRANEARLEAERAAIQKEREEIEAERARMEQARRHQAEIEAARVQAAQQATLETEARLRREAKESVERASAATITAPTQDQSRFWLAFRQAFADAEPVEIEHDESGFCRLTHRAIDRLASIAEAVACDFTI